MRRRRRKHRVRAQIVRAGSAVVAVAAGDARFDGDAVADLDVLDRGTDGGDGAAGFVAEDDGRGEDEVADAAALPVVDVGHADAGLGDADDYIVGVLDRGFGEGGEGDFFEGFEEERGVGVCAGGCG